MDESIFAEIERLRPLKAAGPGSKYEEVFGEPSRSVSKEFLFRRITWRLQVRAEEDLRKRALDSRRIHAATVAHFRCSFLEGGVHDKARAYPSTN